jgi:hypothetical protein
MQSRLRHSSSAESACSFCIRLLYRSRRLKQPTLVHLPLSMRLTRRIAHSSLRSCILLSLRFLLQRMMVDATSSGPRTTHG